VLNALIVSQGLIQHQDGVSLHPDLFLWEKELSGYSQKWFDCADKNPLGWYAALCERSPTALLAEQIGVLPEDTTQWWTVSPYHAQMARNAVRVLPEGLFPWSAEDADDLSNTLNPFLAEDGMQLIPVGAALLLSCREPIDAYPQSFATISGQMLPDRHHEGEDGGRLNRLLSEIQMVLFQHPSERRRDRGEPDVNGIWFWAPVDAPVASHAKHIAVATRNPALQSVVDGKDANVIITEAERLGELVQQGERLPERVVLAGDGHAVLLSKSWLPKFGKTEWKAKSPKAESALLSMLRSAV